MLGAALLPLAALLPIVGVESAPECPNTASIVDSLALQIEAEGRASAAAGSEGEYVLRVDASSPERLRMQLADGAGRVVLTRDLPAANATCDARARAVAVVVDRWLAGLPVPPSGLVGASLAGPGRTPRPAIIDVHVGPALTVGFEKPSLFAGVDVGFGVRPLSWLRLALDGAVHLPRSADVQHADSSIGREALRLRAAAVPWDRGLRFEVGPSVRLELTTVSVSRESAPGSESRAWAAIGVGAELSAALVPRLRVHLAVEGWLALGGDRYVVGGESAIEDVYRTPRGGLQIDLLGSYDLL